ncbi:hypothetical protein VP01_2797g1 [Puccinia sorghi]|uniref:Uncharacterized protein n=1 Tax=Puccinia sorghi TaxID=27349 RepID=A0A0L6V4E1_9BASI|nr:hypothetical protein VP01_2797g1 [Puccinia sorghi]
MTETRSAPVVCRCQSFRCSQKRFRGKDGEWAAGAIVDTLTKVNHAAADAQIAARFLGSQDTDDDEEEDSSDSPEQSDNERPSNSRHDTLQLNLQEINLSSRHPSPSGMDGSNAAPPSGTDEPNDHSTHHPSTSDEIDRSSIYDCICC